MKKRTLLLLGCIIGCTVLGGCGKTKETVTESATEAPAETSAETQTTEEAETPAETETKEEAETSAETETKKEAEESAETQTETAAEESGTIADKTIAGWHIVVESYRTDKSLENISVDLGYTGVETNDFKKEAAEGKKFCLVKLLIEKENSKEVIEWEKMKLTDGEGNEYARIEDAFLTDLGMMRMPGTDLNFGSNEGWIVFEIDENADNLTLAYPFETEEFNEEL